MSLNQYTMFLSSKPDTPYIQKFDDQCASITKVTYAPGQIDFVLSPVGNGGFLDIRVAGLDPGCPYSIVALDDIVVADENGEAVIQLFLDEKVSISVRPLD